MTLAATTVNAAICGQRSFWKYVSTAIAIAMISATMKTSTPIVPALYGVARDEGEKAAEEDEKRVGVAKAGLAQQIGRAQAEPRGGEHRAGQVPGAVRADQLQPRGGANGLAGGRDAKEEHAQRPR